MTGVCVYLYCLIVCASGPACTVDLDYIHVSPLCNSNKKQPRSVPPS